MNTARELMAKAERAAASAKLLLEAGDVDGARCSRWIRGALPGYSGVSDSKWYK